MFNREENFKLLPILLIFSLCYKYENHNTLLLTVIVNERRESLYNDCVSSVSGTPASSKNRSTDSPVYVHVCMCENSVMLVVSSPYEDLRLNFARS